jgi:hypothetical protein
MTHKERFLLYQATPEQKLAILMVLLFLESLDAAAIENGEEVLHVHGADIHEHFREFVAPYEIASKNPELYQRDDFGDCPAVLLYFYLNVEAAKERKGAILGHIAQLYIISLSEARKEIEEIAKAIKSLSNIEFNYETLVVHAKTALEKIREA